MTRFDSLSHRLGGLEAEAHRGMTPTRDDEGNRAWVEGSGLHVAFEILQAEHNAGRELTLTDFLPDLQEQIKLWSRAELTSPDGQAAKITKELCQQIMKEGHR